MHGAVVETKNNILLLHYNYIQVIKLLFSDLFLIFIPKDLSPCLISKRTRFSGKHLLDFTYESISKKNFEYKVPYLFIALT